MVRNESLSSTRRMGSVPRDQRSICGYERSQPAGHAGAPRLVLDRGHCLLVLVDLLLQSLELGERLVALLLDRALLHRIAAIDEVGPQHVDPVLQGLRERLAALHLAARVGHAARPVRLIASLAARGRSLRRRAGALGC